MSAHHPDCRLWGGIWRRSPVGSPRCTCPPVARNPEPCPARQPVDYFDGHTTNGITNASLPCLLVRGHDGHHVCETPAGPYLFEKS